MDVEWLRRLCLALPHTTEQIQWEDALVFKVGGRMYAVARLEPAEAWLSFKCGREEFAEVVERPGLIPAPYLARAYWAALDSEPDSSDAPSRAEIELLVRRSYELVFSALPRKTQASLEAKRPARSPGTGRPRRRTGAKRKSPRR